MKRIIFFLIIALISVSSFAQVDQKVSTPFQYRWIITDSAFGLPFGPTPVLRRTSQLTRPGFLFFNTADSTVKVWTGTQFVDAVRSLGEVTQAALDDTAAAIRADFPTGSAANTNAGAFYRWLKPATQEIKTFANGYGILLDSTTNTDALTVILDSANVFPDIRATIEPNLIVQSAGAGEPTWYTSGDTLYLKTINDATTEADSSLTITGAGTGANTALSNLASVAINTSLISDANNTDDLGSTSLAWKDVYAYTNRLKGSTSGETTFRAAAVAGTTTIALPAVNGTVVLREGAETLTGAKTFSATSVHSAGLLTNTSNTNSNFIAFGGGTPTGLTTSGYIVEGADGTFTRFGSLGSSTAVMTANYNYAGIAIGGMTITEGTSGTHPLISAMVLRAPTVTGGAAATANMATLYIEGAPSGVTPTGGTWGLWNKGASRFDGLFSAGATALTANQIWGANSGATAMEGKTLTEGQNINITHGAGTVTFAGPTLTKNINLPTPGAAENEFIFFTPVAITVTNTRAVLVGSSTPSVTYNIAFGTDRTVLTNVYTAGQTVTSTTTGTDASGVNDATIPANSWVVLTTSAQSGTVTAINASIQFTED